MAKRKEVIRGLHNIFQIYTFDEGANGVEKDMYEISEFSYEQSVDENTILFVIADSEDVGRYITINGEPKIISENDNFIITNGVVFSGNGGNSSSGVSSDEFMKCDGSNYISSLNLVSHQIAPTWTIKDTNGVIVETKNNASIDVENGAKVDFKGIWSYENSSENQTKVPTACSGHWGSILPKPGVGAQLDASSITSTTSYSQTISAPKSGLEVKNNKVVKASGDDTSTKTVKVTFKPRIYYGATELAEISSLANLKTLLTDLSTTFEKTFTANCTGGKYIYLAYPSSISGTPEFTVNGFGTTEIEETNPTITNDYGADINYKVLRIKNIQNGSAIPVIVTKK